jgi:hypothetical protein
MAETTQHSTAAADAAKKENEARAKVQQEQRDKLAKAKPTPTQDENDRAVLGEHIKEHADDGSGPDPSDPLAAERAKKK